MPISSIPRGVAVFALAVALFAPFEVAQSGSADCGSPDVSVSNGARPADDGVYVVYQAQIVTIRGAGWSSCGERAGGCIRPSRPAPVSSVDLELVRASADAASSPQSWERTKRVIPLGSAHANDDYSFAADQVTMPTHHGHFMLIATASGDPTRRAVAYISVL